MDWQYWGKPVPGYGDINAKYLIVGLAPAAHGGNRTGRVFTGDKSAEFLMQCLYDVGMTNQSTSIALDDGLELLSGFMTPVLKCVPPHDKPTGEELSNCYPFFIKELKTLVSLRVILALGKIAFDSCLKYYREKYDIIKKEYPFGMGIRYEMPDGKILVSSYHPSPRNVNTKKLTYEMMVTLLESVKGEL
jgi:uracil-DNA glycosylase family 4